MHGEAMRSKARPRSNIAGHVANSVQLTVIGLRKERDQQILKCDHAYLQSHKLSVFQRRDAVRPAATR